MVNQCLALGHVPPQPPQIAPPGPPPPTNRPSCNPSPPRGGEPSANRERGGGGLVCIQTRGVGPHVPTLFPPHPSILPFSLLSRGHSGIGVGAGGAEQSPPPPPREVLEWPYTVGAPQTKVTIAGRNEAYNRQNLVGPFLGHKLPPPPPHPAPKPPPPWGRAGAAGAKWRVHT